MRVYHDFFDKIKTETLERNMETRALVFNMNKVKQEVAHEKDKSRMIKETLKALHSLAEIGQILTATLDEDQVLDLIYEHTQGLIDADVLGVCHFDPVSQTIDYRRLVHPSQPRPLKQISIHDPKSLAARCIREKRTIFYDNLDHESMKSVIYTPLMVLDQVVGAFTIQKTEAFHYSKKTLEIVSTLTAFVAIALKNSRQSMALEEKSKALEILSRTDDLTNLYNRRHMIQVVDSEYKKSIKDKSSFCIALVDVDHFKNINDTYGHSAGDLVLKGLSEHLENSIRTDDILARWGGEEFLIMFPKTSLQEAKSLCQSIRINVEHLSFEYFGERIHLTISMGISIFNQNKSLESMFQEADRCLYKGKDKGRNCVVTIDD
jgi:diguanylate cyclase (GGDEF)-like protein